jgi:integrase
VPTTEAVTLAPEQVALLLDAAAHTTSPWLGPWTVLAAATGARNGELCGLERADLDLDAGTVQFRPAPPSAWRSRAAQRGASGGGKGREIPATI